MTCLRSSLMSYVAFVELTERWDQSPVRPKPSAKQPRTSVEEPLAGAGAEPTPLLASVCNLDAHEARALTRLVYAERKETSKPLSDHLCAMCGQLLGPDAGSHTQSRDTGRLGKPSQCRDEFCNSEDMPPFLLLFSKRLLARRLPAVSVYDEASGRLTLHRSLDTPPWLISKPTRGKTKGDEGLFVVLPYLLAVFSKTECGRNRFLCKCSCAHEELDGRTFHKVVYRHRLPPLVPQIACSISRSPHSP